MRRLFYIWLLVYSNIVSAQELRLMHPTNEFMGGNFARFTADGKYIITDLSSGSFGIWNALAGKMVTYIQGNVTGWSSVEISPDSKYILAYTPHEIVDIYSIDRGEKVAEQRNFSERINSVKYSPDGKKIIVSGRRKTFLYSAPGLELLNELAIDGDKACYSPDGKYIAGIYRSDILRIYDAATNKKYRQLEDTTGSINSFAYSPDGRQIVLTTFMAKYVTIWNLEKDEKTTAISYGNGYMPASALFSPDGTKILTYTISGNQHKIWDISGDKPVEKTTLNIFIYGEPEFSKDGKYIIVKTTSGYSVYDAVTGALFRSVHNVNCSATSFMTTPDSKSLLIWGMGAGLDAWTIKEAGGAKPMINTRLVTQVEYSPDKNFITTLGRELVEIWSVAGQKKVGALDKNQQITPNSFNYSPDGKSIMITTNSVQNPVCLLDAKTGEVIKKSEPIKQVKKLVFPTWSDYSPDGKNFAYCAGDSSVYICDAMSLKAERKFDFPAQVKQAQYSPDGKQLFVAGYFGSSVIDPRDGHIIWSFDKCDGSKDFIYASAYSPDGKRIATTTYGNKFASTWDAASGKLLFKLNGHSGAISHVYWDPEQKYLVTSSVDGTGKIWDGNNGRLIYTFQNIYPAADKEDQFSLLPSGYYKCTPNAAKLLYYVTPDLKIITFEQLDAKYNRPDKVLEAIGNTDTALIRSYRKAWEKRMKKLGIDTTAFRDGYSIPEADFADRDGIGYDQKTGTLKLRIKATGKTFKLDRFNIWVNEVPVFGQRGISLRRRNLDALDTAITIKLSAGENSIETSVADINGTESYRMPLIVNYTPAVKQKEITRFIGIGIDKFADNKYNLQYSAKDIRDLSRKLKEKYGDAIVIDTLFNENVTFSNIKALKQKLQQTTENDKVIIAYSGHGMLSKDYDYYLSTYSVNFEKPEQNGLPYDELENLLDSIPARKKLMLIDACHSGEVDKEDLLTLNDAPVSLVKGLKPVAYKKEGQLGLKNSFELMQSLFVNVGKSTGAIIISAAAGTQFALERGDLKNGVFTYSILEAMNKYPTLKISELKKIVSERVEELTKGLQKPTSRNETIAVDWNVW